MQWGEACAITELVELTCGRPSDGFESHRTLPHTLQLADLTPFTFVFFLAHTVREVVREGERDVTYGALAGLSLFMLVVGALGILL